MLSTLTSISSAYFSDTETEADVFNRVDRCQPVTSAQETHTGNRNESSYQPTIVCLTKENRLLCECGHQTSLDDLLGGKVLASTGSSIGKNFQNPVVARIDRVNRGASIHGGIQNVHDSSFPDFT